jgi:regulatory protein
MVITAIKQQVKNTERANIFVDNKYSFSLTLDELVRERLKNGLEIDEARLKALKKLSEEGKLRMKALNWVLLRPHSEREFRDYLYRKKADKELIEAFVEEFTGKNYLNDTEFARWWYEQRAGSNRSDRFIRSELMKKGVGREIIDELLSSQREPADDPGEFGLQRDVASERQRLRAVIGKKGKLPRYKADPLKFKQFLLRQGFSYDDIRQELADYESGE